jgi:hypothetical protein
MAAGQGIAAVEHFPALPVCQTMVLRPAESTVCARFGFEKAEFHSFGFDGTEPSA